MEAQEPTYYELEREKLISDISENLAEAISNLNTLNRNIEANTAIGSEFDAVSRLWKDYERVMANTADASANAEAQPTGMMSDNSKDAAMDLPDNSYGMAPGAGSTSYVAR